MSKLFLSFFTILTSFSLSKAQPGNLVLANPDRVVYGSNTAILESFAPIVNVGDFPITVGVTRNVLTPLVGSKNYFCWDVCYLEAADSSLGELTLPAGDTIYNFYGHFGGQGNTGIAEIQYCFFDISFPADSVCYVAQYYSGVAGVESLESATEGGIVYPNPASGDATFTFKTRNRGNHNLQISNILGSIVLNLPIDAAFGQETIDVSQFENGLYSYKFENEGKTISAGKLIIAN